MSLLVLIMVVLIVLAIALYGAKLLPIDGRMIQLIQLVMIAIAIAIVYIVSKAGLA